MTPTVCTPSSQAGSIPARSRPGTPAGRRAQRDLDQPHRVGRVAASRRPGPGRTAAAISLTADLAVLGGVADVVAAAGLQRGNRSRSASTVCIVSSTDSVVWESQTTCVRVADLDARRPRPGRRRAGCARAPPRWCPRPPRGPRGRSAGCRSRRGANRLASWCTLVTSGQVASIVRRSRAAACVVHRRARRRARRRRRRRPRAPRRSRRRRSRRASSRVATTCRLCTICLRT